MTLQKTSTTSKPFIQSLAVQARNPHMKSELQTNNHPAMEAFDEESLMTPSELAAMLRVPVSWVYAQTRGRSKAGLPFVKMGRYVRFDRDAVRKFIAENAKVGR